MKNKYDKNFQGKIVASLVSDLSYLKKIYHVLDPTLFEIEAFQQIVKWAISFYDKYKDIPNQEYFSVKLQELNEIDKSKSLSLSVEQWLDKIYKEFIILNGLDFVKDESFTYFVNQNWKKTILTASEAANNEDFDLIQKLIKDATNAQNQDEIGISYKENIRKRYEEDKREAISTGYPSLDEIFRGGFGKGDLITIIAPSGIGKSWLLNNFGASAVKRGYNILHYTFELTDSGIAMRYDNILTKIPIVDLIKDPSIVERYVEENTDLGNIQIVFFPMKSITVSRLKSHIEQVRVNLFNPDLVLVDYGDLLKPKKHYTDKRNALEEVFEDLKTTAQELQIPIVTATQSNRNSVSKSIIGNDDIAESYNKVFTSDIIMAFSRKLEDKIKDVGLLNVTKNRYGPDGKVFDISTNLLIGEIKIHEENENVLEKSIRDQRMLNNGLPNDKIRENYIKFRSKRENNLFTEENNLG